MTLIFSVHYFLWYGALTSIFGYESVYARHYTNSTAIQYGYLNMALPFITVLVTPVICSMADRGRQHRSYFTISLVITAIALIFYALLPLIVNTNTNNAPQPNGTTTGGLLIGPWIYYCLTSLVCDLAMAVNTCLSDSFAILQAEEEGSSFGRIIVWGTFGWASSAMVLSIINQWSFLPRLLPGLILGSLFLTIDVFIVSFWHRSSDFALDTIPIGAAQTLTGSASPAHKEPSDYMPLNESARINFGTEIDEKNGFSRRKTKSPVQILTDDNDGKKKEDNEQENPLLGLNSSIKTINSELEPSKTVNQQTSVQMGTTNSSNVQNERKGKESKSDARNSLEISNKSDFVDKFGAILTRKHRNDKQTEKTSLHATSFRMQLLLIGLIMQRRKSLIRYLILFILSGFFMSMHWNYFFLYLERIFYKKFELTSGLSMVGQSLLGELPFFILSRKVIDCIGRSHTLSISMISIGIRFLLYCYLLPNVGSYYVFLADCLQGPNYGLFYVVMTEVGLEYSYCDDVTIEKLALMGEIDRENKRQIDSVRLSLRSTIQSVAFACYEGIGVGTGSLIGGWMVATVGFESLWSTMAVGSILIGLINIIIELTCREEDPEEEKSERSEFMEAKRGGTLRKVASPQPLPSYKQTYKRPPVQGIAELSRARLLLEHGTNKRYSK